MKLDGSQCVQIFSVPVMGILGIDKPTKMVPGFVAYGKTCWIYSILIFVQHIGQALLMM
jgi:hypothetical protein